MPIACSVRLRELELDLCDGLPWVEVLRASLTTVHDRVAPVHLEGIIELLQALRLVGIPRVSEPAVRLEEHRGAQVLVGIPPVGRARSGAASAENTFVY